MIGNKLHNLIKDLSNSQLKTLISECRNSNDKRLLLFDKYLSNHENSLKNLNNFFDKEVAKMWPNSSAKENELKTRRLTSFYSIIIEKIILSEYLEDNSSDRNILLANTIVKNGNIDLVNYYYDKAYLKAIKEEDKNNQIASLKGKIQMIYASQNEKKIENALTFNKEIIELTENNFKDSISEYYSNISNIYLEKNSLVKAEKDKTINEIEDYLKKFDDPLLKTSLHTSLAKLNFDSEKLLFHFIEAEKQLESVQVKDKIYFDLQRKLYFLELRLNFFSGKGVEELIEITDKIFKEGNKFSIINNNTIFYRILFKILDDKLDEANAFLEKNHVYFKGEGKMLEQFLKAIIFEKTNEPKKAIQLLQPIIYSSNYFMSVFSRLVVIKIYTEQNNFSLLKSLIDSTQRFLLLNFDNPLGMDSHLYVLNILKTKQIKTKSKKGIEVPKLTIFHKYLLGEI